MNPFFILGLPRSRTLWFSQLFTFDDIECKHEYFSKHEKRDLIPGVRGYSDTNPLIATDMDYGDSPVLIIERDIDDVIDSVSKAFDKPEGIVCWHGAIARYIDTYKYALDSVMPKNCLRVDFESINDSLPEIWKFLLPDIPVDTARIEMAKNKIIKTNNRNIQDSLEHTFGSIDHFKEHYDFLNTYRITDYSIARYIMEKCWYEISEDGVKEYVPDIVNEYWIGLSNGEDTIGCYRFHQINKVTWQGHVFILPEYREKYSKMCAKPIFEWILSETDFQKVIADVPQRFPNVMGFLEKSGFQREGVNRLSHTKDGNLWDIIHYGITRQEIEELM